jgi:hypothetical protein
MIRWGDDLDAEERTAGSWRCPRTSAAMDVAA